MLIDIEALWVQVHFPDLKPTVVSCCHRNDADTDYLTQLCEATDTDVNSEIYLLGDINIDWLASDCPRKKQLLSFIITCNVLQIVSLPTRVFTNPAG